MRFDPATYPGPRPPGPALLQDGRVHRLVVEGKAAAPWRRRDGGPVPPVDRVRFSVAYGANASPPRLIDKGLDRRGAVLLPARMVGWAPVFEARRTGYGAVPLTLLPAADPHEVRDTWVLGIHVEDLPALDRSEGRDPGTGGGPESDDVRTAPTGSYVLAPIGPVVVAERFRLADALAYRPGPGTRVLHGPQGPMTWPEAGQAHARMALAAGAGRRAAGAVVDRVVRGPWPATVLGDIPPSPARPRH